MVNTLECDCGTLIWALHFMVVTEWRWGSWEELIRRARIPPGGRKAAAWGRMALKCSTARRVTTSGGASSACMASARAVITLMFVNVSARATSRRNVDFL